MISVLLLKEKHEVREIGFLEESCWGNVWRWKSFGDLRAEKRVPDPLIRWYQWTCCFCVTLVRLSPSISIPLCQTEVWWKNIGFPALHNNVNFAYQISAQLWSLKWPGVRLRNLRKKCMAHEDPPVAKDVYYKTLFSITQSALTLHGNPLRLVLTPSVCCCCFSCFEPLSWFSRANSP